MYTRKQDHFEEAAKDGQLSGLGFGQGQEGERRIHLSTFLAPLLFMVLHHLVLSGASVVRLLYFLGKNPQYQEALLQDPAGTSMMEILLEGNVMTYASLMGMLVLIPAYLLYLTYRKRKAIPLLLCQRISPSQLFSSLSIILGALGLTQVWMVILASLDPASLPGRLFQDYLDKMMLFDGRSADCPWSSW